MLLYRIYTHAAVHLKYEWYRYLASVFPYGLFYKVKDDDEKSIEWYKAKLPTRGERLNSSRLDRGFILVLF